MPTLGLPPDPVLTEWPRRGTVAILDLEYTAWDGSAARSWGEPWEWREIVQIGAVLVDAATFSIDAELELLVKPTRNPRLSAYFRELTGIDQSDVDTAGTAFGVALRRMVTFLEEAQLVLFNGVDGEVLRENCTWCGVEPADWVNTLHDMRPLLARTLGQPLSAIVSSRLPALAGLPEAGHEHSALNDCLATARSLHHWRAAGVL